MKKVLMIALAAFLALTTIAPAFADSDGRPAASISREAGTGGSNCSLPILNRHTRCCSTTSRGSPVLAAGLESTRRHP